MMIDSNERFCLSYKTSEPNIKIFMRKFDHGYIEKADSQSREGCAATNLSTKDCFMISDDNIIVVHDEETFKALNKIQVPLNISYTREVIEILNIVMSKNETFLGILSGKILPK